MLLGTAAAGANTTTTNAIMCMHECSSRLATKKTHTHTHTQTHPTSPKRNKIKVGIIEID
jgi:uncharacterized protein YlaI